MLFFFLQESFNSTFFLLVLGDVSLLNPEVTSGTWGFSDSGFRIYLAPGKVTKGHSVSTGHRKRHQCESIFKLLNVSQETLRIGVETVDVQDARGLSIFSQPSFLTRAVYRASKEGRLVALFPPAVLMIL